VAAESAARMLPSPIESVESVSVAAGWRNYVFVLITTEDGRTGLGESTLEYHEPMVARAVSDLGQRIRGLDAGRIEHIWQFLYRGGFWRGGPVLMSAISGIDQALWDLKGKAAGMPIYELLGGPTRDYVTLYGNGPRGASAEELAASARAVKELGFANLKLAAAGPNLDVDTEAAIGRTVDIVRAVRDAVGGATGVAVDAHARFSPTMAIKLAKQLEPLGIWFLEEPARPENPAGIAKVAGATTIPIATGERLHSRWDFRPLIESDAIALAQPDLAHCGGISEARRIAAMAEVHQIGVAPHNPMSPVNTLASAHLAMAIPNFVALEYLVDDVPWSAQLLDQPLDVADGILRLPDRPGLGAELDLEVCAAHPPEPVSPLGWLHADGSLAEW
jgi:galactonate dehydratase